MDIRGRGLIAYRIGCILWSHSSAIKEETDRRGLLSLTLTESIHKLLQLRAALDLEEDFIVVVCDLDIEVLDGSRSITSVLGHDGIISECEILE